MFFGVCKETGMPCAYDLPNVVKVETVEQFEALVTGYNYNSRQRAELQGQPRLKGLAGPMFNGYATRKSTGELVAVIRYEYHKPPEYLKG